MNGKVGQVRKNRSLSQGQKEFEFMKEIGVDALDRFVLILKEIMKKQDFTREQLREMISLAFWIDERNII